MKKFFVRFLILTLVCIFTALSANTYAANLTKAEKIENERNEIREMSKTTLQKLYEKIPIAEHVINISYGYATLSNTNTNVILLSKSQGRGVAINNKTGEEIFMRMKEVGVGLGAGIREYDLIFVFDDREAWDNFLSGKTKLGAEASASATDGNVGGTMEGATLASKGIWVYQITTKGLALEATVSGTKFYPYKKLNKKY